MTTFTIRRARPEDASEAARIIGGALAEYGLPFEPEGRDADVATFGTRRAADDVVDLVAEDARGIVLGVGSIGPHGKPGIAWVSKLFVTREARGIGAGRALLEAAHEAARARGYREVALRTRVVFDRAIALYEKAGYVRRSGDDGRVLASGDVIYARLL